MDVAFHTEGQGKKAADPEAPALEQILALAADLTKDSLPDQIKTVLGATAKAALGPIAKDKALGGIHDHTGIRVRTLKRELELIELEVHADSRDMGRVLANTLLKNCFHGGDHLLHSADGSYWAFNGRHWEPTSDRALGKLLMMEAAKSQPFCTNMQQLVGNALKRSVTCLAATRT
jgi:hypothetical protein